MAELPKEPYGQFNFLVDWGTGVSEGRDGGFDEVSGIDLEGGFSQHSRDTSRDSRVVKITGLNKSTDVTLKRGVVSSRSLDRWLDDIRKGNHNALRTVSVHRQNEGHSGIVQAWKLLRARIIKHISGPLNAKGTDVAIEELVLAYERLEIDEECRS
jgi:phage tail-like protein